MTPETLENRLIIFSSNVIKFSEYSIGSFAAKHLLEQLIRSSSSSALNYGEARGAMSTKDFKFKLRICLKELRESLINLKIQSMSDLSRKETLTKKLIEENNELISIFVATLKKLDNK